MKFERSISYVECVLCGGLGLFLSCDDVVHVRCYGGSCSSCYDPFDGCIGISECACSKFAAWVVVLCAHGGKFKPQSVKKAVVNE